MKIYLAASLAIALCAFSACNHKELCDDHPHVGAVTVAFDWSEAPDARPDGMCVFFYPADGSAPTRVDIPGRDGGSVQIAEGDYLVMAYNNDTDGVTILGTSSPATHVATTRTGDLFDPVYRSAAPNVPRAKGAEDEPVRISPDMMWGAAATPVTLRVGDCITLTPKQLVRSFTFEISNVTGLRNVTSMCGSLSGLAASLNLADGTLGTELATIPFGVEYERIGSSIKGRFLTFGFNPEQQCDHRLMLYIWMNDGKKYCIGSDGDDRFCVTSQIHSAADPFNVHFVIDGLLLPEPPADDPDKPVNPDDPDDPDKPVDPGDDSGYGASFDDWSDEHQDIYI